MRVGLPLGTLEGIGVEGCEVGIDDGRPEGAPVGCLLGLLLGWLLGCLLGCGSAVRACCFDLLS